ncbi:adipose-secreted signaling protein [Microcaecilia unicolor]|uniref:Adipose-secreted signaling protein n=1 Tax=Microcaecilia unicolor TaxID=1415580 RepID=A0A6P7X0E1_9AMPH|nr:UPF0687 protein C20orf27 homolog [Microcaecilia unicolor]
MATTSKKKAAKSKGSGVHFEEKLSEDSIVKVLEEEDGNILVKVGFLKILHKYEITFVLPTLKTLGSDIYAMHIPNLNLKVTDITPVSEGHSVKCEYVPCKEGVQREEMMMSSKTDDNLCMKVVVKARVMDKHHGTPMLLEGVRCIGSEQSVEHGSD